MGNRRPTQHEVLTYHRQFQNASHCHFNPRSIRLSVLKGKMDTRDPANGIALAGACILKVSMILLPIIYIGLIFAYRI